MALSKKSLKRRNCRNYINKTPYLLVLSAVLRMNEAAKAYNLTAQQGLSSKHHPEQAFRDAVRLRRAGLWDEYSKAKTELHKYRRKYGTEFTKKIALSVDIAAARNLEANRIGLNKPGWIRKKITNV